MPKRPIAPLVTGRIRLRLLEEGDLPMTLAWRNQDEIRQWFFHSEVITPEQHRGWWDRYRDRDDDFVFVIEETDTLKRPVGQVALYNIDWAAGVAEFGRLMIGATDARGLGLARQATARLVDEGLGPWGLRVIHLEVMSANSRALAIYQACAFGITARDEGIVRMSRGAA